MKTFYSVRIDPSTFAPKISAYNINNTYYLRAVSSNYLCALIFDTSYSDLKIVSFWSTTANPINDVPRTFYTGYTLTDTNNTYDVSDDCKGVRVNKVVGHRNPITSAYQIDTYPSGTT